MDHNLIKLQELSNFLNEKYQMDTYIDKSSEVLFNTNYKLFVIKRVIYIVLLIFLYCYILSFKNKHIVLLLIKIIIILIIIFNIYILIINKLTKEHEEKINNHIRNNHTINNIENIEFKTGDVIQQIYYWNIYDKMINLFYFQNNVHNLFVINFNNNNTVDIFVNGNLERTFESRGRNITSNDTQNTIDIGSNNGLYGAICNINYYAIPLTQDEIIQQYNLLYNKNPPTNNIM